MDVKLPPGKYALAVSGGVDSVVLLDLLTKKPDIKLVVAHFDHGIRKDSFKDATFVANLAKRHGFKFELGKANLGKNTSEEKSRKARYEFLREIMAKNGCKAVITAHHQDDLIETALINLLRGTGSAGLVSLKSAKTIRRPLLMYSKKQILGYAKKHRLKWREDKSNQDRRYLRNRLRLDVIPRMTSSQKTKLLENIDKVAGINKDRNIELATLSQYLEKDNKIKRGIYSQLENAVAEEYLHSKLRDLGEIDRKTIARVSVAIKTAKAGSKTNIVANKFLVTGKEYAWIE